MSRPQPLRHKAGDIAVDLLIPFGRWLLPVLLTVGGFTLTDEARQFLAEYFWDENGWKYLGWGLLAVGAPLYVLAGLASTWRTKRVSELEQELDRLSARLSDNEAEMEKWVHQLKDLVSGVLYDLCKELGFGTGEKHLDRLTIYAHEADAGGGGRFVPFGRVSFNPAFEKLGRQVYPDDQGIIAQAWLHGEAFEPEMPDFREDPEAYYRRCEELRMPREAIDNIRMKSQFYYGKRIHDESGRTRLAVVILESKIPNRYNKDKLRSFFGRWERTLSQLVQRIAPILPGTASGAGY